MKFFIVLDNNAVFVAGSVVSGTAILQLNEPCSAREVYIEVIGHAKNHWSVSRTETHTNSDGTTSSTTHTDNYDSEISVFNGRSRVWGTGNKEKIPDGEHRYPFTFQLPPRCLPSYEGSYGHIRYSVRARVDRPWKFDHKATQHFTVALLSNLNLNPVLKEPLIESRCEKTGLPLFRRGDIALKVELPKRGFVPGEAIAITLAIDNMSSRDMESAEAILHEKADFAAYRSHTRLPVESLYDTRACGDCHRRTKREVQRVRMALSIPKKTSATRQLVMKIPAVSSSFECGIIRVYYTLKLTVSSAATFGSSIDMKFPIVIGNVPIVDYQPMPSGMPPNGWPSAPSMSSPCPPPYPTGGSNGSSGAPPPIGFATSVYPTLPSDSSTNGDHTPSAPPLPSPGSESLAPPYDPSWVGAPPSYEESVFGASAPTKEDEAFAPRYPIFHNLNGTNITASAPPLEEKETTKV